MGKRDNWHHLSEQPPMTHGEKKVRKVLQEFSAFVPESTIDKLGLEWGQNRYIADKPEHDLYAFVEDHLANPANAGRLRPGVDFERKPLDPLRKPWPASKEDETLAAEVMADMGEYYAGV